VSWVADSQTPGSYVALRRLSTVRLQASGKGHIARDSTCQAQVTLTNPADVLAFFVRLRVLASDQGQRILPVFYEDNYVTILPGETVKVRFEFRANSLQTAPVVTADGWNTAPRGGTVVPVQWARGNAP